jgi:predicted nucleic acid-binding protein
MTGADTTFLVQLELIELPAHVRAHEWLRREVLDRKVSLAVTPQVLAEFIHVVTDPRRFQKPLTVEEAVNRAHFWWNAAEVKHLLPSFESTQLFLDWMLRYRLGRKRILDTQFAANLWTAGVRRIITENGDDFRIFGFEVVTP